MRFVDFITRLDFPYLYCLGHSGLPVIKNNLADLCCVAGNDKELHLYTHNRWSSLTAATSHMTTAATINCDCLFSPCQVVLSGSSSSKILVEIVMSCFFLVVFDLVTLSVMNLRSGLWLLLFSKLYLNATS